MQHQAILYILFFAVPFLAGLSQVPEKNDNRIGPFKAIVNSFKVCSGPKIRSCTAFQAKVQDNEIYVNAQIVEKCAPLQGKILGLLDGKTIARIEITKLSKHPSLWQMFSNIFNMTESGEILKGTYKAKINVDHLLQVYTAGISIYGNFTFKTKLYSGHCNFICSILDVSIIPV